MAEEKPKAVMTGVRAVFGDQFLSNALVIDFVAEQSEAQDRAVRRHRAGQGPAGDPPVELCFGAGYLSAPIDLFESTNRGIDERFGRIQYWMRTTAPRGVVSDEDVQTAGSSSTWLAAPDYSRYNSPALEFVGLVPFPASLPGRFLPGSSLFLKWPGRLTNYTT